MVKLASLSIIAVLVAVCSVTRLVRAEARKGSSSRAWQFEPDINPEEVCTQPEQVGSCDAGFENWYYNPAEARCFEFIYGGCEGNENNFSSREECESFCQGIVKPSSKSKTRSRYKLNRDPANAKTICNQPVVEGPCMAAFPQWYYDPAKSKCFEFIYGGCEGNDNRFEDSEECGAFCKGVEIDTDLVVPPDPMSEKASDICPLPKDGGPCLAYIPRWYYDPADARCYMFIYKGCEGNKNSFSSREKCESFCQGVTVASITNLTSARPKPGGLNP